MHAKGAVNIGLQENHAIFLAGFLEVACHCILLLGLKE